MKASDCYDVGDIVKLKSGGPEMAVSEVKQDRSAQSEIKYRCQWFAGKKLDVGLFPHQSLIKVEEGS